MHTFEKKAAYCTFISNALWAYVGKGAEGEGGYSHPDLSRFYYPPTHRGTKENFGFYPLRNAQKSIFLSVFLKKSLFDFFFEKKYIGKHNFLRHLFNEVSFPHRHPILSNFPLFEKKVLPPP